MDHKVEIDLFKFIKSGTFDFLEPGQTREWVLDNFPNPDGFKDGDNWRNGPFEIFTYGDFELHFSSDILYLIFADFHGILDGGPSLSFPNPWLFQKDTGDLNLPFVMNELLKGKIDFSTIRNDDLGSIVLRSCGGVEIYFEIPPDPNDHVFRVSDDLSDYLLGAISLNDTTFISK